MVMKAGLTITIAGRDQPEANSMQRSEQGAHLSVLEHSGKAHLFIVDSYDFTNPTYTASLRLQTLHEPSPQHSQPKALVSSLPPLTMSP
ncbi:hypothetical protein HYDPIDRAFT_34196 [Hydnomerulius pinastri MD-312]|uniref:Unplaced genomic scaffold scaffold_107, whole genome shotgun sequence n=1 Tax=Hydnomerulius pinastri MD-312 TaxID=994086 RepID=A0A0C9UZG8_9AGAM|nr:hypothetical protein HYDPIDRAFT_34196 [Hydnomerulius pinastri MD-312]